MSYQNAASGTGCPLTPDQLNVLTLAADGLTNRQIGAIRHNAEDTVKTHLRHILQILTARSRAHAVAIALRNRWIT